MEISQFISHHGLSENPFTAEEARFDPVFDRLTTRSTTHQDFDKILGDISRPSTAVVFGEKGSGKTAIRLRIARLVSEYNAANPGKRTLLVAYDDLNPVLDRVAQRHQRVMSFNKASRAGAEKLLSHTRLADHQDAILSLAVTRVIDGVLGVAGEGAAPMPADVEKKVRSMPRDLRVDLAVLAALYDQPRSSTVATRWGQLRRKLKLRVLPPAPYFRYANIGLSLIALLCWLSASVFSWGEGGPPGWLTPLAWITGIGAVVGWVVWGWSRFLLWKLCYRIQRDLHAVQRQSRDLMNMLLELKGSDIAPQPWPVPGVQGEHDSRFQLTNKLMNVLEHFGYTGMMVLVDRVDEPSLVAGKPECMKPVVWPMLDHKFLQQDKIGIKMLLPIELRHLVHREDTNFYQQSRLDKQNMVDRLTWSGATLYDMCTNRLRACRKDNGQALDSASTGGEQANGGGGTGITLRDLFAQDVTRQQLVEALDQMHQPRDAFKFLYAVIQEHCRTVSQDEADYLIPRLTLEGVRRHQAQRVQDLQRGMTPS